MKLVLCGFMGSGKTRVGKELAKRYQLAFYDMDKYIEKQAGRTIKEIFESEGEASFREMERRAVKVLIAQEDVVIACGGGTVMGEENVIAIHQGGGVIVFLDIPLSMAQKRLESDKKRPLIQRPDRVAFIETLYQQRRPIYRMASDFVVPAGAYAKVVAGRVYALLGTAPTAPQKDGKKAAQPKKRRRRYQHRKKGNKGPEGAQDKQDIKDGRKQAPDGMTKAGAKKRDNQQDSGKRNAAQPQVGAQQSRGKGHTMGEENGRQPKSSQAVAKSRYPRGKQTAQKAAGASRDSQKTAKGKHASAQKHRRNGSRGQKGKPGTAGQKES